MYMKSKSENAYPAGGITGLAVRVVALLCNARSFSLGTAMASSFRQRSRIIFRNQRWPIVDFSLLFFLYWKNTGILMCRITQKKSLIVRRSSSLLLSTKSFRCEDSSDAAPPPISSCLLTSVFLIAFLYLVEHIFRFFLKVSCSDTIWRPLNF